MPSKSPFSFMKSAAERKKVEKMWADRLHLNEVNEEKLVDECRTYAMGLGAKLGEEIVKIKFDNEKLQDEIKKLKEEKSVFEQNYHDEEMKAEGYWDQMVDLRAENKKLKEENEKLKEEVEEWKEVGNDYGQELYTPSDLHHYLSATIHEDEELYSKYMEPISLREENEKLKQDMLEMLEAEDSSSDEEDGERFVGEFSQQRAENQKLIGQIGEFADFMADHEDFIFKKITGQSPEDYDVKPEEKEEDEPEERGPDCCEGCDTEFDLTYTMNHCDPALRKKYDAYFGSPDDDGDMCAECMDKNY